MKLLKGLAAKSDLPAQEKSLELRASAGQEARAGLPPTHGPRERINKTCVRTLVVAYYRQCMRACLD